MVAIALTRLSLPSVLYLKIKVHVVNDQAISGIRPDMKGSVAGERVNVRTNRLHGEKNDTIGKRENIMSIGLERSNGEKWTRQIMDIETASIEKK